MTEKWTQPECRPTPGVSGYLVSEDGDVFSCRSNWRGAGIRKMRCHVNDDGYLYVRLTTDGRRKKYLVHQLVCKAFHGERPSNRHQVRHLDGTRTNNVAANLTWGTVSENARDRVRHGTQFYPPWDDQSFRRNQIAAMRAYHAKARGEA